MKILINEKLSQHRYLTPEGYLVCVDSVLARTGKQTYRRNEVFGDAEDDSEIEIDRTPEEVFSEETLASFENKPITVEHPDEDVNSENYKDYAVGFVRDIHRGRDNGQDVILGTLVIQDKKTIDEIKNGEHTDLSCGYDCDITEDEHPQQRNIRGNHVALCAQGRAGNARIVDTAIKDEKLPPDALRFIMRSIDMYSTQMRNNIDVNKIIRKIEEDGRREGYSIKFKQEKVGDWEKGNVKNSKDYVFGVDGYSNKLQISIYADPKTGKINEMSGFVKDSEFNDGKLPASLKKDIQRILAAKSTYTKYDLDISDVVRDIERYMKVSGHPIKLIRKKIVGWNKMGDGMMRKDYFFNIDGYSNEIMISLYADPDTWKTTEVNGYFTDAVKEETMEDAMSKSEAIQKIKNIVKANDPLYIREDKYEGIRYLTQTGSAKISEIAKSGGLNRKDMENIDWVLFGPGGYYSLADEEMELQEMDDSIKDTTYLKPGKTYITKSGGKLTVTNTYVGYNSDGSGAAMIEFDYVYPSGKKIHTVVFPSDIYKIINDPKYYRDSDVEEMAEKYEKTPEIIEDAEKDRYKIAYKEDGKPQVSWVRAESLKKAIELLSTFHEITDIKVLEIGDSLEDASLHTYDIKWMDIYAKSKGWADYKHHHRIKAGTLREALKMLGDTAGFGIGTNNMLIVNIHRDDGRTYTYTDRLANLLKKTDLADEEAEDSLIRDKATFLISYEDEDGDLDEDTIEANSRDEAIRIFKRKHPRCEIIKATYFTDAVMDAEPDSSFLNEIKNKLKSSGLTLLGEGKLPRGGYHFGFKTNEAFSDKSVNNLALKLNPIIQFAKSKGYPAKYEMSADKNGRLAARIDILKDSVKDAKQLPNTAELTKIERMLSDAGLLIVQIKYGSTSYEYNLKPKGSIFTEYKGSDARVYQRKLAKIKNEVENTYGYPVTYNVVEPIPGRLVITFAVNAKNTKDAVEDADSFTYKGIFVAKLPHAYRFTLKGKTYEVATDKKAKEIIDGEIRDSVKDELVEPDESVLRKFEAELKKKAQIESKRKNFMKGYHYQTRLPKNNYSKRDLEAYAKELERITKEIEKFGCPITYNTGLGEDGSITAGVDIYGKSMQDSMKDASEMEESINACEGYIRLIEKTCDDASNFLKQNNLDRASRLLSVAENAIDEIDKETANLKKIVKQPDNKIQVLYKKISSSKDKFDKVAKKFNEAQHDKLRNKSKDSVKDKVTSVMLDVPTEKRAREIVLQKFGNDIKEERKQTRKGYSVRYIKNGNLVAEFELLPYADSGTLTCYALRDSAKDAAETNYKVFVNTNKGKFEYITKAPSEEIAKKKIGKYVAREILKTNEKEINNFKINATPLKKGEMDWSKFVYYFNN